MDLNRLLKISTAVLAVRCSVPQARLIQESCDATLGFITTRFGSDVVDAIAAGVQTGEATALGLQGDAIDAAACVSSVVPAPPSWNELQFIGSERLRWQWKCGATGGIDLQVVRSTSSEILGPL